MGESKYHIILQFLFVHTVNCWPSLNRYVIGFNHRPRNYATDSVEVDHDQQKKSSYKKSVLPLSLISIPIVFSTARTLMASYFISVVQSRNHKRGLHKHDSHKSAYIMQFGWPVYSRHENIT